MHRAGGSDREREAPPARPPKNRAAQCCNGVVEGSFREIPSRLSVSAGAVRGMGLGAVLQPHRAEPVRHSLFLLVADLRHLPHRRLDLSGLSVPGEPPQMTATLIVFLGLFVFVALLGLFGSRWRAGDLSQLHEWGLGGRSFGTLITWFLLGGDLYTAYTFIAVPALMFGAGATGFFAVPYAALMYPVLFMAFPRLWSVANKHG